MLTRPVTVVIPTRTIELMQRAVASLAATHCTLDGVNIVVVDDGLPTRPRLVDRLIYIDGKKPFCFATNVNLALQSIEHDHDVVLMNDDTEFLTTDGLLRLSAVAHERPQRGMVTPVFVRPGRVTAPMLDGIAANTQVWDENEHFLIFPVGFFKRELVDRIGLLDETFVGYGFDDNDYCLRSHLNGFELAVVPNVVVAHGDEVGPSTTYRRSAKYREWLTGNRDRFVTKWARSFVGLTDEQIERLMWWVKFSFDLSPLSTPPTERLTAPADLRDLQH